MSGFIHDDDAGFTHMGACQSHDTLESCRRDMAAVPPVQSKSDPCQSRDTFETCRRDMAAVPPVPSKSDPCQRHSDIGSGQVSSVQFKTWVRGGSMGRASASRS